MGVCGFFLQVKFATSLLASLAGGSIQKYLAFDSFTCLSQNNESNNEVFCFMTKFFFTPKLNWLNFFPTDPKLEQGPIC